MDSPSQFPGPTPSMQIIPVSITMAALRDFMMGIRSKSAEFAPDTTALPQEQIRPILGKAKD